MKFNFSWKTTLTCGIIAALMVRASVWQWDRHVGKQEYIRTLESRIAEPPADLGGLAEAIRKDPAAYLHRRVQVSGEFDFSREMVLRNRRYKEMPGVFVITPLKISGQSDYVLVNRGFVPLSSSSPERRTEYQRVIETGTNKAHFLGLVKASAKRRFLGPSDPDAGEGKPWVDGWLWFDVDHMRRQLPYDVLPVSLEIMSVADPKAAGESMITKTSGRDDMFILPSRGDTATIQSPGSVQKLDYPAPVFDTVVPPGRHLGYVYEWAFMAAGTILIGIVLQLRRPAQNRAAEGSSGSGPAVNRAPEGSCGSRPPSNVEKA